MPFSFVGSDIFWTNYFPFQAAQHNIYDPYRYINNSGFDLYYYPPGAFYIFTFFQVVFKPFLPQLQEFFQVFQDWAIKLAGSTVHFAAILGDYRLFRTLFIFKLPYLICDFLVGFLFFKLLQRDRKKVFVALAVWVFNPFVLYGTYAAGQFDIAVALCILLAIFFVGRKRYYFASAALAVGTAVKLTPVLLLLPLILVTGKNIKEYLRLFMVFMATFLLLCLPFFISSGWLALKILNRGPAMASGFMGSAFLLAYALIIGLVLFFKRETRANNKAGLVILSFTLVLLAFYNILAAQIRYFIWATPLFILLALQEESLWKYLLLLGLSLFTLRLGANMYQLGVLAPIHPEFFSSLPAWDSFANIILEVKYIYSLMLRLFMITSLLAFARLIIRRRQFIDIGA